MDTRYIVNLEVREKAGRYNLANFWKPHSEMWKYGECFG
jgi:hypothetical protein